MHEVNLRVERLRDLDFEELNRFPETTLEKVRFGDVEAELNTYRIRRDDASLDVVVQAFPPQASKRIWKDVCADGFRIEPSGERRPLTERELYGFM